MAQPFLSVGAYKAFSIIGIQLTIALLAVTYFSLYTVQKYRVEKKIQELNDIEDKTHTPRQLQYSVAMQTHWPTAVSTVGFFLIGIDIATFSMGWALLLGLALVISTGCHNRHTYGSLDWKIGEPLLYVIGSIACIFLLYASMAFTNTSMQMKSYAHYTYRGPMNVVGFDTYNNNIDYYDTYLYKNQIDYSGGAMCPADIQVNLLEVVWECPGTDGGDATECSAEVEAKFCDEIVCTSYDTSCVLNCTEDDYDTAEAASLDCIERNFNDTVNMLNDGEVYNASEGSEGWDSETMYGDCSACTAEFQYVVDGNRFVHNAYGFSTSISMAFAALGASLCWAVINYTQKKSEKNDEKRFDLMANEAAISS